MAKSPDAFRTIGEVAEWLDRPAHVLRFWESKFSQIKPVKRAGGRRYYRPEDMLLLGGIKRLLHEDGVTIKGVQKLIREQGVEVVCALSQPLGMEDSTASAPTATSPEADMPGVSILTAHRAAKAASEAKSSSAEKSADSPTGGDKPKETVANPEKQAKPATKPKAEPLPLFDFALPNETVSEVSATPTQGQDAETTPPPKLANIDIPDVPFAGDRRQKMGLIGQVLARKTNLSADERSQLAALMPNIDAIIARLG